MTDGKIQVGGTGLAWAGVLISKWLAVVGVHGWSEFAAMLASLVSIGVIVNMIRAWLKERKHADDS